MYVYTMFITKILFFGTLRIDKMDVLHNLYVLYVS